MYPNICQIYGPIYLNCYGLCIFFGIITFIFFAKKNHRLIQLISFDKFSQAVFNGTIIGIIGGRLLWAITNWKDIDHFVNIFKIWEPGFSSLGTLIGILIFVPFYLRKNKIPILPVLDIVAIYAPLLHAIARIGCFLAGCCHGIPTKYFWGVIYTHPDVVVPNSLKFIKIHPTQLYSAISLLIIFMIMYFVLQNRLKISGQLLSAYLLFASIERFFNDFLRSDRDFLQYSFLNFFSIDQWIAISIFLFAIFLAFYTKLNHQSKESICNYEPV